MTKTYHIETRVSDSVVKEEVQATNAFLALEQSKLAAQPLLGTIEENTNVDVTVVNVNDKAETLSMSYKFTA